MIESCLMDDKCIIIIDPVLYCFKLLVVQINERGKIDTWQQLQKYGSNTICGKREFILSQPSFFGATKGRGNRKIHMQQPTIMVVIECPIYNNQPYCVAIELSTSSTQTNLVAIEDTTYNTEINFVVIERTTYSTQNTLVAIEVLPPIATTTRVQQYNTLQCKILQIATRWV